MILAEAFLRKEAQDVKTNTRAFNPR